MEFITEGDILELYSNYEIDEADLVEAYELGFISDNTMAILENSGIFEDYEYSDYLEEGLLKRVWNDFKATTTGNEKERDNLIKTNKALKKIDNFKKMTPEQKAAYREKNKHKYKIATPEMKTSAKLTIPIHRFLNRKERNEYADYKKKRAELEQSRFHNKW